MSFFDPYQAYVEGSVFGGNPLNLVIALYEGTIDSIREARHHLETGDIVARTKAINKSISLLTELLVTLDADKGGEVGANLKRLYSYIQCRVLTGHAQKATLPLLEAEKLLTTMLEGWREAADKFDVETREQNAAAASFSTEPAAEATFAYGFFSDPAEYAGVSATF